MTKQKEVPEAKKQKVVEGNLQNWGVWKEVKVAIAQVMNDKGT